MSERKKLVDEVALDLFRRQHPTPGPEREKAWLMYGADYVSDVTETIAAIEAAGVRLVNFAALAEDDAAVEKVARALCALANPPESLIDPADHSEFVRTEAIGYRADARAAIRAMYAAFVAASPYAPPGG